MRGRRTNYLVWFFYIIGSKSSFYEILVTNEISRGRKPTASLVLDQEKKKLCFNAGHMVLSVY